MSNTKTSPTVDQVEVSDVAPPHVYEVSSVEKQIGVDLMDELRQKYEWAMHSANLRELENTLHWLARTWRKTHDQTVVVVYSRVMTRMFNLGWNGHLDLACELPYELMPEIYFE